MGPRDPVVSPLQAAVHRRLAELARHGGPAGEVEALAAALRAVLAEHRLDAHGRCVTCRPRRTRLLFWRRGRIPCRAYLAAQLRLGATDPTGLPEFPARRHRGRAGYTR
ncbi:hypothetical protein SAMN05421810_104407 [Amycolatopsis arida]|uniref:Uncharacterized protein n=1 Tax=Amycolatopsis arida TaxID=587909 RepID=A0A1I5VJV7_9PSEU|nr:hypothetical protein [Amycolatopsis arida]TDX87920.1 hypothetical protein CLV69_11253 [Amycolatopsis arida]SFQ07834.1 hypothetical protein SAMN05421810_104407 [Amycolatopsis arida]